MCVCVCVCVCVYTTLFFKVWCRKMRMNKQEAEVPKFWTSLKRMKWYGLGWSEEEALGRCLQTGTGQDLPQAGEELTERKA